jgi:phage terminase large subunit-like protein
VALIGESYDEARDVMIFGESGILACSPPDRRPEWEATRRRLVWPNGAVAQVFSAHDPEGLRGPQFDAAWVDELAKWKKGEETWDNLQFALRLGEHPQQVVTTTPRNVEVFKDLLKRPSTVVTHAPTEANSAWLAQSFLEEVRARFCRHPEGPAGAGRGAAGGCRRRAVDQRDDRAAAGAAGARSGPDRGGGGPAGDRARGIGRMRHRRRGCRRQGEAAGLGRLCAGGRERQGVTPLDWARKAIAAFHRHGADRLVAEVNQGGDMIETLVRQVDPHIPFRGLRAGQKKGIRAEPVAALYEQARVKHVRGLPLLEDQMVRMTAEGYEGKGSPDRVDALVWAIYDLILAPSKSRLDPQIRGLG